MYKRQLDAFRRAREDAAVGVLYEACDFDWEREASRLAASFVHPHEALATEDMIDRAHGLGLGVMAWTVDDAARAHELVAAGVDALCTNRPDVMQNAGLD